MTASERSANQPHSDAQIAVPGHPGRWRIVSLVAVAVAALIVTISIVQDRRSADREPPGGEDALEYIDFTVAALPDPAVVIRSAAPIEPSETTIDPSTNTGTVAVTGDGQALVVALTGSGQVAALAITDPTAQQALSLDERSTAQTLLMLSPALLDGDVDASARAASLISTDPMHDVLVAAISRNAALVSTNDDLGSSLAAVLDRVPLPSAQPDQGCDSISSLQAYTVAGTCVVPGNSATTIQNEQDRWVLVYGEPDNWSSLCTVLPPATATGTSASITADDCGARALVTSPGPLPDDLDEFADVTAPILTSRHDAATALMLLDDFVLPYAAVTAGIDGYNDRAVVAPSAVPLIVRELSQLMASDQLALDAVRAAYDPKSTPAVRHRAAAHAAHAMLSSEQVVAALPAELGQRTDALELLDFYDFTASFMTAERSGPIWTAAAAGVIDGL